MSACSPAWQERLSACFDGEATSLECQAVKVHAAQCTGCAREAARFEALRTALRAEAALHVRVPARLEARVRSLGGTRRRPALRRPLLSAAAAVLVVAGSLWGAWPGGMSEALAADLEAHHLRAFARTSPCEFESSRPEEVEAWLEHAVGYPVDVPRVPGATLLGARRCRLGGQLSAHLLYRHGDQALTLFIPPPGSSADRGATRFADGGPRCTEGPTGERICVAQRGAHAAMAVSELDASVLLAALEQLPR